MHFTNEILFSLSLSLIDSTRDIFTGPLREIATRNGKVSQRFSPLELRQKKGIIHRENLKTESAQSCIETGINLSEVRRYLWEIKSR